MTKIRLKMLRLSGLELYSRCVPLTPALITQRYLSSPISNHHNNISYYSTIMSFYQIRSRERAKYEAVIHCSVLV